SRPKITIFGKPGVGKTWGALDFPNVYYIDTEGGADLAHYTDKLKKSGGVYFGPEQGASDFETVIEQVKALATEDHSYKTLVIDSLSKIYNLEVTKEAERLGEKDAFGASKKPAVRQSAALIRWLGKLDMNVILICHLKPEWSKGEQIGVIPDAHEKLEYELHLCLQIEKQGDNRIARVKKSRLQEFSDGSNFPWSYTEFSKRYGKNVIEKKAEHITLATQLQLTELKVLLETVKVPEKEIEAWYTKAGVASFEEMSMDVAEKIITHLKTKLTLANTERK
ncbi:MAG TPA: AAA family ATPase, partial [Waddliaceae bacterium]